MPSKTVLKIVDYDVADLEALKNPKNPRWMPDQQAEALVASLNSFGVVEPVILNIRTNQVVGGHQRIMAAPAAGITSLPVVLVDLEPARETALNLLLNKVRGDWDYDKLAIVLADLDPADLIATGFTDSEVDSIVGSFSDDTDIAQVEDSGVIEEIRNRTEEEVRVAFEATEKLQFGMFSRAFLTEDYNEWVEHLKSKSTLGDSPAALGSVVAGLLGIELAANPESEVDESTVYLDEFTGETDDE